MDEQRFDQLSRRFASMRTRRQAVKALAGAVIGVMAGARSAAAQACASHYSPCGGDGDCCAGAVCEYGLCMPGCRINGAFVSASVMSSENICQQCAPESSTTSWSPANEGMSCWSGDPNAGATFCRNGSCVANSPQSCPPPTACHLEGSVNPTTGMCVNPPAPTGTPCGGEAMCQGGFFQPADTCDGNGFCIGGGSQVTSCGYYRCGADACLTSCASDSDCIDGAHCDDGACLPDEGLGTPCDEDSDCVSGVCSDGVCCNQRCDGLCEVCTAENGGICAPVVCTAIDQCHGAGICNPDTGECDYAVLPDGTPCNDNNSSTRSDTCQSGVCTGQAQQSCPPPTPCHLEGEVDPVTESCVNPPAPAGTPCGNGPTCDNDVFTPADTCDGNGFCINGDSQTQTCAPIDECTPAGCDDSGCLEASACTGNETCTDGVCVCQPPILPCFLRCGPVPDGCGGIIECPSNCIAGTFCSDGVCKTLPTGCDPECDWDEYCYLGECVSAVCNPSCPPGTTCLVGNCVPIN